MIIITVKDGTKFKYRGKIFLQQTPEMLRVDADSHEFQNGWGWSSQVFDLFYLNQIESIHGQNEEVRDTPKVDIFSE